MADIEEIDTDKTKDLLSHGNITIVDIRAPADYSSAHIPNAVSVNNENIAEFMKTIDKDKPLLCYCYHGITSRSAVQYFSSQGFRKIYSLIGGFEKWRDSFPTGCAPG